ncbi:hypothetical protein PTSG_12227 [Salpingoeca rosetta]|uniref:EF-hand domain-containing protein n=1 Tax=Salpingoeca rosetta (strain ATCC 50818 / BSB-021) TaxID=946362 RepID=F2U920_SALR5|nr:uncharacterized protein PTSG_12227 [Salpingoeca rosetta]EGD73223.1 hypothetical protein PTSG_12227 [Salpingoeca rosetta]|eukprot:XP_004994254.1 hypothetical protein PTSG_12227 [Salpingoeca rosetta]
MSRRPSLLSQAHLRDAFLVLGGKRADDPGPKQTRVKAVADVVRTEDYISLDSMKQLIVKFKEHDDKMTPEEFHDAVASVIEPGPDFDKRMDILFKKMDTNQNGLVELDEFCSHFMADLEEKHNLRNEREVPLLVCPHLFDNPHRGTILRIDARSNPTRLMTVSDDGIVAMWTAKMTVQRTITLHQIKSLKQISVTDAVLLTNGFRLAVSTTNRDLCFFESTSGGLCHRIVGLSDTITYLYYEALSSETGLLIWGDMAGAINMLRFRKVSKMLFPMHNTPWSNNLAINLRDIKLCDPDIVTYTKYRPHTPGAEEVDRSIKKIMCYPELQFIFSGVALEKTSLVIYDLAREDYSSINIPKGVFTFDFSEELNMIATGGADCALRLWNPYVPSNPLAVLPGHSSPIIHLAFNVNYSQVVTISLNEIIKIWDINEHVCMNTLAAVIPHRSMQKKFPIACMLWHEQTQCLVTACKDELCVTQMSRQEETSASLTSHKAPISCIRVLPEFGHVVTACTQGDIKVWDLTTGELLLELSSTHGSAAITAMTTADNNTRVVTGGSDGSVIVWNTFSGVPTQRLVTSHGKEVTDIATSKDAVYLTGWGGSVSCFRRTPADLRKDKLYPDPMWQPEGGHSGEISTMAFLPPALLATGAADGTIRVWNTNLMKTVAEFSPREAMRHRVPSARQTTGVQSLLSTANKTPVDRVLWLRTRIRGGRRLKTASLVSSGQGGMCQFWSPFKATLLGWFTAAHSKLANEKVRAMATTEDDALLATADTQGYVFLWDISNYCTNKPDTLKGSEAPPITAHWRAHVQPVTDITVLNKNIVITASADCSVRVWSLKGDYIGTFGATTEGSWMLPQTTSMSLEEAEAKAAQQGPSTTQTSARGSQLFTAMGSLMEETDDGSARGSMSSGAGDQPAADASNESNLDDDDEEGGADVVVTVPTDVLGKHVRSQLHLRTLAKQEVRKAKSEIDFSKTEQPGFQFCAPYRVLEPTELKTVSPRRTAHADHRWSPSLNTSEQ